MRLELFRNHGDHHLEVFEERTTHVWHRAVSSFEQLAGHPDGIYTVFRPEDSTAWVMFSIVFMTLIGIDLFLMNRHQEAITLGRSLLMTGFFMSCAAGFAVYVHFSKGPNACFDWTSGYLLEWMLSFDNLFAFHMIFQMYGTPDHLKHKPLFYGILGAVFLRLIFIFVGEYAMHVMWAAHLVFGGFLVYTGIMTVLVDEDDEDPTQQPLVLWLTKKVPFVNYYDSAGNFFCTVGVDENGEPVLGLEDVEGGDLPQLLRAKSKDSSTGTPSDSETDSTTVGALTASTATAMNSQDAATSSLSKTTTSLSKKIDRRGSRKIVAYERRATMLFLVMCCLEVTDLLFAVDSTSAIVAQVSDVFLAYTSTIFAILGMRAVFFIIDIMTKVFCLLKYGVGIILVAIGIKLCASKVVDVPPIYVLSFLAITLSTSIVASIIKSAFWPEEEEEQAESTEEEQVLNREAREALTVSARA